MKTILTQSDIEPRIHAHACMRTRTCHASRMRTHTRTRIWEMSVNETLKLYVKENQKCPNFDYLDAVDMYVSKRGKTS